MVWCGRNRDSGRTGGLALYRWSRYQASDCVLCETSGANQGKNQIKSKATRKGRQSRTRVCRFFVLLCLAKRQQPSNANNTGKWEHRGAGVVVGKAGEAEQQQQQGTSLVSTRE